MAQVPQRFFDAAAVRTWCGLSLRALGRAREEIDAINVYPVADGDTGTNLYLTVESAVAAVEAVFAAHAVRTGESSGAEPGRAVGRGEGPSLAEAVGAMAHGALIGARGNSGTILAQLLRGLAQVLAAGGETAHTGHTDPSDDGDHRDHTDGPGLRLALRHAAESARQAVAHPVEGTVLTVAAAAAEAADAAEGDCAEVARAAHEGARAALATTPEQLPALERAGVVDAGGHGLVTVLAALVETFTGRAPEPPARAAHGPAAPVAECSPAHGHVDGVSPDRVHGDDAYRDDADGLGGPAFEVIYLLEAADTAVARLRERLDALGDSLVVVGGDGLWHVHVHVDDAGAAVEAGVEAGRPYRIRITHFGHGDAHTTHAERPPRERAQRAVVAVVPGEDWPGCTPRPARPPCSPAPGSRPRAGNWSTRCGGRTRARSCCCPTTRSCATPPRRRPSRPGPRASGSP